MSGGFCVYKHTTPNGKIYIGITSQTPERRWSTGLGYKDQPLFFRAIVKYGWDNIEHEVLADGLSLTEASLMEKELIVEYKSNVREFGYNLTDGGFGGAIGVKISEETRRKRSESAKKSWANPNRRKRTKIPVLNGVKLRSGCTGLGQKKMAVNQYSIEGEFIRTWVSLCEVERTLNIHTGKISECCHGKRRTAGGYKWSFAEVGT